MFWSSYPLLVLGERWEWNQEGGKLSISLFSSGTSISSRTQQWQWGRATSYTLATLDFKRAYTNTNTSLLSHILGRLGLDERGGRWMRHLFKSRRAHICINGKIIGNTTLNRGLRQGDPLSPALFNIFASVIPIIFSILWPDCIIIQFADDTIVAFALGKRCWKHSKKFSISQLISLRHK